jgi:hypothetical protein
VSLSGEKDQPLVAAEARFARAVGEIALSIKIMHRRAIMSIRGFLRRAAVVTAAGLAISMPLHAQAATGEFEYLAVGGGTFGVKRETLENPAAGCRPVPGGVDAWRVVNNTNATILLTEGSDCEGTVTGHLDPGSMEEDVWFESILITD